MRCTLSRAAANIISARYDLEGDASTRSLARWHETGWTSHELLQSLLERTINVEPRLERVFVAQRRALAQHGLVRLGDAALESGAVESARLARALVRVFSSVSCSMSEQVLAESAARKRL